MAKKPSYMDLLNAPRVQGKAVLEDGREIDCETPPGWQAPSKVVSTAAAWSKPLESISASVMPDKAQQYNEMYRKHGITGAYHDERGRLKFTSRKQRKKCLELRGLIDMDGGYGD